MGKARLGLSPMKALATERGGRCLSSKYVNVRTPLLWECAVSHRWAAQPRAVKGNRYRRGTWCPECAIEKTRGRGVLEALYIDEMAEIARGRGGDCLSRDYVNNKTPLLWQCEKSHEWSATPHSVKTGSWCPVCAESVKLTLQEMRAVARKRAGRCLSKEYINNQTPLSWQCRKRHEWEATPAMVKGTRNTPGTWCPVCADRTGTLQEMKAIAETRGGSCLSTVFTTSHEKLRWRCEEDHEWEALGHSVKSGSWCPFCSARASRGIARMKEIARFWGGRCLSPEYADAFTPLQWECRQGHRWMAMPATVTKGSWCAVCARVASTLTPKGMLVLAELRGGRCLSRHFGLRSARSPKARIDGHALLQWQCANRHRWKATAHEVRGKRDQPASWCPICASIEALPSHYGASIAQRVRVALITTTH